MKRISRSAIAFALFLAVSDHVHAQEPVTSGSPPVSVDEEQAGRRFQIGAGGLFGHPSGELGDVVGWTGGVGFEFAYRVRNAPLLLGFEGQLQQYSTVSTLGIVSGVSPPAVIDGPTAVATFGGYFLTRLQRHGGRIRPFADGVIGLVCSVCGDDKKTATIKNRTLGIGLGAGVSVRWGHNKDNGDIFGLDLRLRYKHAGPANYLTNNLDVLRVPTNMLQGYVGLVVF
jgi:hypothetical protein